MTDAERDRLAGYLRDLADRMGLRDWTVSLLDEPPDDRRKIAEADCVYGRKRINVGLADQFFRTDGEKTPESKRQTLVHELIHAHLAPMHLLLHRILPDSQWEGYQITMEYAVDGIAEAWAPCLPLMLSSPPRGETPMGRQKAKTAATPKAPEPKPKAATKPAPKDTGRGKGK